MEAQRNYQQYSTAHNVPSRNYVICLVGICCRVEKTGSMLNNVNGAFGHVTAV
jgi:hypothetical protein